jgi:two-component system, OmpR family, response regulator ChvI
MMAADVSHDAADPHDAIPVGRNLPAGADAIRILLVENDDGFREALADELSNQGFAVRGFPDGDSLQSALDAGLDADVILLAWKLPKTSGIDLVPRLRRRGITVPIVFLTSHSLPENERMAFDSGAVDFIDKARGVEVLVSRLRRLRRLVNAANDQQPDNALLCSKLMLRPATSRAYWNQADVGLTVGEYNAVHLLASNVGQYVTYRAIYDRLHYEGFLAGKGLDGYRVNVRTTIKRIRKKFLAIDPSFEEIESYRAFGYRWGKSPKLAERDIF